MKNTLEMYYVAFALTTLFASVVSQAEISDQCLGCICHASTGCNKDQGCTDAGVCGPFLITYPFWIEAGKYALSGSGSTDPTDAYRKCSNDLYCASETVRGYTRKFGKDCNNDGAITCDDFARIHRNGPYNCGDSNIEQSEFYKKFSQCNAQVRPQ